MSRTTLATIAFLLSLFAFHYAYRRTFPVFTDVLFEKDGTFQQITALPFMFDGDIGKISLLLLRDKHSASTFRIFSDDCLEEVRVNGLVFHGPYEQCNYPHGQLLNLSKLLRAGPTRLEFKIKNNGGPGAFDIAPIGTFAEQAPAFAVLCFGLLLSTLILGTKAKHPLYAALIFGLVIRCLYFVATPYWVRSHDAVDHLGYIKYVATNKDLPPPNEGVEYHQAPLYYVVTAALLNFDRELGVSDNTSLRDLQFLGLLANIGAFAALLWAGEASLRKKSFGAQLLFGTLLATIPGFIFPLARISNDTLFQFLSALIFALLVRWWVDPSAKYFYGAIVTLVVATVTKLSALSLVPLPFLLLAATSNKSSREKIRLATNSLAMYLLGVAPYCIYRARQGSLALSGGSQLNPYLAVPTTWREFLTFNPLAILSQPFVATSSDETRRQYIWEVLFRTTFFGEFRFDTPVSSLPVAILFLALVGLAFAAVGLIRTVQKNCYHSLPVLVVTGLLLISLGLFHFQYPFAFTQDFRFVPLLAFPAVYFAAAGVDAFRQPIKTIGCLSAIMVLAGQTLFLGYLIVGTA